MINRTSTYRESTFVYTADNMALSYRNIVLVVNGFTLFAIRQWTTDYTGKRTYKLTILSGYGPKGRIRAKGINIKAAVFNWYRLQGLE